MDAQTFFWVLARICGLTAFLALSISLVAGVALRSAVFEIAARNRSVRAVHEYTAILWLPLGALHVLMLVLDSTARISVRDVFVPFLAPYDLRGTLAIGLGTLTLDILLLVVVTSWLRRWIDGPVWRWVHRLSYVAFGLVFVHSLLGGSDFNDPLVSALTWGVAGALAVLSLARAFWGRLPA